jgi:hypothetical protein
MLKNSDEEGLRLQISSMGLAGGVFCWVSWIAELDHLLVEAKFRRTPENHDFEYSLITN